MAQFADFKFGQRVLGNVIQTGSAYSLPEGWQSGAEAQPTWKMGGSEEKTDWGLVVLEPDASLNLKPSSVPMHTYIQLFKKTEELVESLQAQSAEALQDIMGLSAKSAKGHAERFQSFHKLPPKQAILMLGGDALQADDFSGSDEKYVESHLRMVSGLYGVLRPYDDVKPVRDVPMNAKLATKKGKTVVEFWGDAITKQLVKDATASSGRKPLMILVLSSEYLSAIQLEAIPAEIKVVKVQFEGAGDSQTRKARSMFGRWCVRQRVDSRRDMDDWEHEDWKLDKFKSTTDKAVFVWAGDPPDNGKKDKKSKKEKGSSEKAKSGKERSKRRGSSSESSRGRRKAPEGRRKRSASRRKSKAAAASRSRSRSRRDRDRDRGG
eukprot:CAMPEP_0176063702 /NCGR_PEP_ID=MMETSP0120_2-20121206/31772_1 /TAXON_ID=160619 /ORGANISM="Kryptoperidinium foliaceum, Strain CCMP 1326" /LENGTH=378 /DNA_ID=CAMNT_0017397277 /DNA_START=54 /DNA_END=1186 /DNA_ORIENTATION=+